MPRAEVETTRRGIEGPHVASASLAFASTSTACAGRSKRNLPEQVAGQREIAVGRARAKYLLLRLERGTLIVHLGMSGSLRLRDRRTRR